LLNKSLDQYAVIGNPIGHSKSPNIHRQFAKQTKQNLEYTAQCAPLDDFAAYMDKFFSNGGKGANITVPFKLEAMAYASRLTPRAERAGAVNTLVLQDDGTVLGETTDGLGMCQDIQANLGWSISGKRVLILGAGGAVRGVIEPILEQAPAGLTIANRTVEKAQSLFREFESQGLIQACGFENLVGQSFDLVINGTSASLAGDLPPLPVGVLAKGARCYDMMYGAEPTVFMAWARSQGAAGISDGLGMLVEQAAESFVIWRGCRPQTDSVMAMLRDELTS